MKFIKKSVNYLRRQFFEHAEISNYNILAVGVIGTLGHPLYWLWWTYIDPQPNENLLMRIIGTVSCSLLLLRRFWPAAIKRFLPVYYFITVAYTLPFFFTYYLISSHYSMIWSIAEAGMIFLLLTAVSAFFVWLINLILGVSCAILFAIFSIPQVIYPDIHLALYIYFPTFIFCICAGTIFHYGVLKDIAAFEKLKNKALQALAGTIAHEVRNPMSRIKYTLDMIEEVMPAPTAFRGGDAPRLSNEQVDIIYHQLAQGQVAIERGLQVVSMTLAEVGSKSFNMSHFK